MYTLNLDIINIIYLNNYIYHILILDDLNHMYQIIHIYFN